MSEATIFYCEMCKIKHSRIEPRAQCPMCARTYCHNSLKEMMAVGVHKCPFCNDHISNFTGLSWELKQKLSPTVEYVAPDNASKPQETLEEDEKITKKEHKFSVTDPPWSDITITKADEGWGNDVEILSTKSEIQKRKKRTSALARKRILKKWHAQKKKQRQVGSPVLASKRKRTKLKHRQKRSLKMLTLQAMAVLIVLLFVALNPNLTEVAKEIQNRNPQVNQPVECKFQFELYGGLGESIYNSVNDGWISIYEDMNSTLVLETQEIKNGFFSSQWYYNSETLFHIRYSGSDMWANQNRSLLLIEDYIWGRDYFPTDPATIEIMAMFLSPLNSTGS